MANKQIKDLPAVATLAAGDMLPTSQAADLVTREFTLTQLFALYNGLANVFTVGPQTIQAGADANKVLILKGNSATQSGNFLEAQDNSGGLVASIAANGSITVKRPATGNAQFIVSTPGYGLGAYYNAGPQPAMFVNGNLVVGWFNGSYQLSSSYGISWSNGVVGNASDIALFRAAAGVIKATDGASGTGWLQNSAGASRVTATLTNATIVMSNVADLTATLIAGRKYFGEIVLTANNSTATDGLQFDFNGGTATATSFQAGFASSPPGATVGALTTTSPAVPLTVTGATITDRTYVIKFAMVCNAGGTFIPRFAAVAATTGTATVKLNSFQMINDSPN